MRSQPNATVSNSRQHSAVPLGPDSLTWQYFGDWRGLLQGLWAGSMQNMHPKLGAAVIQHSLFFTERRQRLFRSLYPIGGVVYDGDRAERTGHQVRNYHRDISGTYGDGQRYHALDPDVFYWAHSTFFMGLIRSAEHFMGGLTDEQKRQLFDEHVQWYRMYGLSMRPVPETWEAFQEYWDHMCREVLEDNKATRDVLDLTGLPPFAPIPTAVWKLLVRPIARSYVWLTVGLYDEPVRELLGYSWSPRDEWLHRQFGSLVNNLFRLVPPRRRLHPRARAGFDRATGRIPMNTPLVETPDRNLPPIAEFDNPRHYNPYRGALPTAPATD